MLARTVPGLWPDAADKHAFTGLPAFQTAAVPLRSGWVAVVSDTGTGDSTSAAVALLARSWDPDFVVNGGDMVYYAETFKEAMALVPDRLEDYAWAIDEGRFIGAIGNHDRDTPGELKFIRESIGLNALQYAVRFGDMEIFVADSLYPTSGPAPTLEALNANRDELEVLVTSSTARDKLVVVHHPPYASANSTFPLLRWPFHAWGVKLVISGHNHFYERLVVDGVTYTVNGNGGQNLANFGTINPNSVYRYKGHGAMRIKSASDGLLLESWSVDGTLLDWSLLS